MSISCYIHAHNESREHTQYKSKNFPEKKQIEFATNKVLRVVSIATAIGSLSMTM